MHINHQRGEGFKKSSLWLKEKNKWWSDSNYRRFMMKNQQKKFRQNCKKRCRKMMRTGDYDLIMRNPKWYLNPWDWD